VTVLGAGGAARAICAGLQEVSAGEIRIVSRGEKRARDLAQEVAQAAGPSATPVSWVDREAALADISLLVNGTPLGMSGSPPLDLALDLLPETAVVYDTVYAPLETALLQRAKARGNPVADGLGMLIHQARPAFEAWFGVMPGVTPELREILEADLRKGEAI
jgi:shikimate dehydrogenase